MHTTAAFHAMAHVAFAMAMAAGHPEAGARGMASDLDDRREPTQRIDALDALFDADGNWREAPASWQEPRGEAAQQHFQRTLQDCIAALPPDTAQAFMLRELMGYTVAEIAVALGIGEKPCAAMLQRARLRLHTLLDQRWFKGSANAAT
jgi:RNA polymerase sigma factor (sigma-70 family)